MKFVNIYQQTEERMRLALLSLWAPGGHPMRPTLEQLLKRDDERLIQEPVFQSTFGWEPTDDNNWDTYLNSTVVDKLKIGAEFLPYKHQTKSWKALKEGNSIVVTSGTGSGKTECFMYPVISDLYEQPKTNSVQAIFLYPLNALMEDQKKRLNEYCESLGLKFAVYNSDTPNFHADYKEEVFKSEVPTREEIRDPKGAGTRPQILLTNPSMLEYILVRKSDQKMLQDSKGKLRWIIIDEAHSYSGSAAVELAYQIKRILDAFGTDKSQVRFACTSATIGEEGGTQSLADFISTITGQPTSQITVIGGNRKLPDLDEAQLEADLAVRNLPATKDVMKLRKKINEISGIRLSQIWTELGMKGKCKEDEALKLVDELCEMHQGENPVLSLRVHFFMRSVNGLYCCANENCSGTSGTRYGHITTKKSTVCECCGMPLLELVQCKRCGSFIMMGQNDQRFGRISQCEESKSQDDYFTLETEDDDLDDSISTAPSGTFFLVPNDNVNKIHAIAKAHVRTYDIQFKKGHAFLELNKNDVGAWRDLRKDDKHAYCPNCGRLAQGKRLNFKHFRIPISFVNETISPVLLHECATNNRNWGKYIAFTDSRQGTAISAKTFNINVERTECREKALKLLASKEGLHELTEDQQATLAGIPEEFRATVKASFLKQLQSSDGSVSLEKLADEIYVGQIFEHISTTADDKAAYKAALLRGFIGRKPLYETNIETMGLLTLDYPMLKNVKRPEKLEIHCRNNGIKLEDKDWQDYLKIVLDYYIRLSNHIQPLADGERKYIRDSSISTPLAGPTDTRSGLQHWLSLKCEDGQYSTQQPRLVLLLCAALGVDCHEKLQNLGKFLQDTLNDAWYQLVEKKILKEVRIDDSEGYNNPVYYKDNKYVGCYYLDLSNKSDAAVVKRTKEAWVCPVVQTLLDTTFCEYSPLMIGEISPALFRRYKCTHKIEMPMRPKDDNDVDAWMKTDEKVQNLKALGFWSDRFEQTYKVQPVYLAAEHSAQQSKALLRKYTKAFSQPNPAINVLHCSTTMEMGVDIGSIDTVVMDTIPPTAANYLQRVGRAGRMRQSKALAFSLCNNTPIGQNAFANPMWALDSPNPMIQVKESSTIVQRHANSFFFRQFICGNGVGIQATMSVKEFMDNTYKDFIVFLNDMSSVDAEKEKFRKVFGQNTPFTIDVTRKSMEALHKRYSDVVNELEEAFNTYQKEPKRQMAISNQKKKYENTPLLSYLSENQFIPNANMPTGVVKFDFMDKSQAQELHSLYKKAEKLKAAIEAASTPSEKMQLEMELNSKVNKSISDIQNVSSASREIVTALNEYAPEQTVVVNEKNYVSAGVTLFGAYNENTQSRGLYYCKHCGHVSYSPSLDENKKCPNCNSPYYSVIDKQGKGGKGYTLAYEPIGFRTDQNVEGSREERTEKRYYDIRPILLEADWTKRMDINLCQVTSSGEKGELLFYNVGDGRGFAFCKRCGRAAVEGFTFETGEKSLPKALRPGHKPLWTDIKCCEANINDIARNVVFTGKHSTCYSVFRFLKDPNSGTYENDEELAYTMGVVLSRALAKYIGIDEGEIGFGVKQELDSWLLFIYDTAKGGCGYSLRFMVAADCQRIFDKALETLKNAPCECERSGGACTSCLVDRNNYRFADKLSKGKAIDWLERQHTTVVSLPSEVACASANAMIIYQGIKRITRQAATSHETKALTFCVSDNTSDYATNDWKSVKSEMGHIIHQAIDNGIDVKILVEYHPEYHLSLGDKLPFIDLQNQFADCTIELVRDMGKLKSMLFVETSDGIKRYFTDNEHALSFSNKWGAECSHVFVDEQIVTFSNVPAPTYEVTPKEIIRQGITGASSFPVGHYFSEAIAKSILEPSDIDFIAEILGGQDVDVSFSDTFVNCALSGLMLTYLVNEMRNLFGFTIRDFTLQLESRRRRCENSRFNDYTPISFNFDSAVAADEYIDGLIENVLGVTPEHSALDAAHCRWLKFVSNIGVVEIRPDHGISGGWMSNATYMSLNRLDGNTHISKKDDEIVYYIIMTKA